MREYRIPSLDAVAYAGAAWLAAIALLLVVPLAGNITLGDLIGREIVGGLVLLAAVYVLRTARTLARSEVAVSRVARASLRRQRPDAPERLDRAA